MFISYPILALTLLFIIVILCIIFYQWKKNNALKSLCRLSLSQRITRLNELLLPLGFHYDETQDTFFLLSSISELPDILKNGSFQDYFFYHGGHTIRIRMMAVCDGFLAAARAEISYYRSVIPFDVCDLFPMEPLDLELCPYMELTFCDDHHTLFSYTGRSFRTAGFQIHPQTAPSTLNLSLTFHDESARASLSSIPGITFTGQTAHLHVETSSLVTVKNRMKAFAYYFFTSPTFRTVDRLLLLHIMRPRE